MIQWTDDDLVRVVTIDRPARRNALTPDGLDELERAVTTADTPVVYVHGAGEAFCAGADLDVVVDLDDPAAFARHGQQVADAIAAAEAAVVAGIDGAARGGGVELALACDLRIATPNATFAETGVKLGLFGAWGGTVRLPAIVGYGNAADLTLSGRTVDASEAHRMGLVSRVVDDPRAVADELAATNTQALGVVKERLFDDADPEAKLEREAAGFAHLHREHLDQLRALRAD